MAPQPQKKTTKLPRDMDLDAAAAHWGVTHWAVRRWITNGLLKFDSRLMQVPHGPPRRKRVLLKGTEKPELKVGRPKKAATA